MKIKFVEAQLVRHFGAGLYLKSMDNLHTAAIHLDNAFLPADEVAVVKLDDLKRLITLSERPENVCANQAQHEREAEIDHLIKMRDGRIVCDNCFFALAPMDEVNAHLAEIGIERPTPKQTAESLRKLARFLMESADEKDGAAA